MKNIDTNYIYIIKEKFKIESSKKNKQIKSSIKNINYI